MRIFLQGVPKDIDTGEVYSNLLAVKNIASIHGLHIWSINSSETFLSCHICLKGDRDKIDTDDLIQNVNSILDEKFGIKHTTLQLENIDLCGTDDECCR